MPAVGVRQHKKGLGATKRCDFRLILSLGGVTKGYGRGVFVPCDVLHAYGMYFFSFLTPPEGYGTFSSVSYHALPPLRHANEGKYSV